MTSITSWTIWGKGIKKYCFSETESTKAMIPDAYRFIEQGIERFENAGNEKLLRR